MATGVDPGGTVVGTPSTRRFSRSREQKLVSQLVSALKQCDTLEKGKRLHAQAVSSGCHTNRYVGTCLINMYSRRGDVSSAKFVFDRMSERDVVSWTSLILGYVENGESRLAVEVFEAMDCEPNGFTYATVLKAHAVLAVRNIPGRRDYLEKAVAVHEQMKRQAVCVDIVARNALIDLYCKCSGMCYAREVFETMPVKDVVSWSSLIFGYVEQGENRAALELFERMDCVPNHVTFAAALKACGNLAIEGELVKREAFRVGMRIHTRVRELGLEANLVVATGFMDMYSMHGSMHRAQEVFDRLPNRNVVSWTCLILGYVENREFSLALEIFTRLDCEANHVTYVGVIKAVIGLVVDTEGSEKKSWLGKGIMIHEELRDRGFEANTVVSNSLLDLFGKGSVMLAAQDVFDRLVERDTVSWNSLILGYAENDQSREALSLFAGMDAQLDSSTFVAALKASAALASIPAGQQVHAQACRLGLDHEHLVANSLVHLYGRCGNMAASEHVFGCMHSPDQVSWNALIGGYGSLGDTSRVFTLVSKLEEAGHEIDDVTLRCVLAACSHAGMVDEGSAYFEEMCRRNVSLVGAEHYNCMIDMHGRANRMDEAFEIVRNVPTTHRKITWLTLLGMCRKQKNLQVAKVAFEALVNESNHHVDL